MAVIIIKLLNYFAKLLRIETKMYLFIGLYINICVVKVNFIYKIINYIQLICDYLPLFKKN